MEDQQIKKVFLEKNTRCYSRAGRENINFQIMDILSL